LFYYVAKHRGVSAAARHIPYGIQQPAISAQILQLEENLGVALFQRRPFDLTSEGRELYAFIEPFFSGLAVVENKLRGKREAQLRIGAPAAIQHSYLPHVLKKMRKRTPTLDFRLVPGGQDEFEQLLQEDAIDVAVCAVGAKSPPGIKRQELLAMPLALLVHERSRYQEAAQVFKQGQVAEPLICIEAANTICRGFQRELQRRKIDWPASLELESFDLVARYASQGFGIGLVVDQPDCPPPAGTRRLRLADFPPLSYAALWNGRSSTLVEGFLQEAEQVVVELQRALR
ncbi:MAG TPA: LysR family transcriptional regulator, partial [Prosthecobacter sp.]|nr:LysR family transcriptional regulator [Prosthecobacter sp.]